MKSLIALLALSLLSSPAAFAADAPPQKTREMMILNHPVVLAVEKLMNEKDAGLCVQPTAQDIRFYCTGAIMPVKSPEIDRGGCGFSLEVKCPSQTARISGHEIYFFLNDAKPTLVKPVAIGPQIESVSF